MDKDKIYAWVIIGVAILSFGWLLLGHYNHTGQESGADAISDIQRASELNREATNELSSAGGQIESARQELGDVSSGLDEAQGTTDRLTEQNNSNTELIRQSRDICNDSNQALERAGDILGTGSESGEVDGTNH